MRQCDFNDPWYHGSPEDLDVIRSGSWVTQYKEMAKAFSHKPSRMSMDDECQMVSHDGQLPGRLYVVAEDIGMDDVSYLPGTGGTHWQTQRDLQVRLVSHLPIDDPPQLTEEEIADMRKSVPDGTTGFFGDVKE